MNRVIVLVVGVLHLGFADEHDPDILTDDDMRKETEDLVTVRVGLRLEDRALVMEPVRRVSHLDLDLPRCVEGHAMLIPRLIDRDYD